jgi:hypothetical protein
MKCRYPNFACIIHICLFTTQVEIPMNNITFSTYIWNGKMDLESKNSISHHLQMSKQKSRFNTMSILKP